MLIRLHYVGNRFSVRADSLLEVSQRAQFDIQVASQWLNLRLQLIGLTMLAGVAALALLQHHFDAIEAGMECKYKFFVLLLFFLVSRVDT